jgi:general stress protein 26
MKPEPSLEDRINRAKQLLKEIHHVPVATVNKDGSPHDSPVFMVFDDKLSAFWASNPETQHSKNIARDDRVFLVVFDSREGHGGLFIKARAKVLESKTETEHGYQKLKELKQQLHGNMGGLDKYTAAAAQRIYQAEPEQIWINKSDRDEHGVIIRDRRHEISLEQLLGQNNK